MDDHENKELVFSSPQQHSWLPACCFYPFSVEHTTQIARSGMIERVANIINTIGPLVYERVC